jgi:hypothetical protein
MEQPQKIEFSDPACQEVTVLFADLSQCLQTMTQGRKKADELLRLHWSKFSRYPDVDQARKIRNTIEHRDRPVTDVDVRDATFNLRLALKELLSEQSTPAGLRERFKSHLMWNAPESAPPPPESMSPSRPTSPESIKAASRNSCQAPNPVRMPSISAEPKGCRSASPAPQGASPGGAAQAESSKREQTDVPQPSDLRSKEELRRPRAAADRSEFTECGPVPRPKPRTSTIWALLGVFLVGAVLLTLGWEYFLRPSNALSSSAVNPASGPTGASDPKGSSAPSGAGPVQPSGSTGVKQPQNPVDDRVQKPSFSNFVNRHVSLSSTQRNVALVIDSAGSTDPKPVADLLNGFLGDKNIRTILNLVDVKGLKANGFLNDFYAGNGDLIRDAIRLSGVDYVLLGQAEYQFRKQPALDPDLITCDLTVKSRLADRRGTIIQSAVFSAPGPGFTEAQAIERAAENIAQQLWKKFFETLQ